MLAQQIPCVNFCGVIEPAINTQADTVDLAELGYKTPSFSLSPYTTLRPTVLNDSTLTLSVLVFHQYKHALTHFNRFTLIFKKCPVFESISSPLIRL